MWTRFFRTTTICFRVVATSAQKEMITLQERMDHCINYASLAYTPVQWVYKIIQFKKSREDEKHVTLTAQAVHQQFRDQNFVEAKGQDSVSVTFVTNAIYVNQHGLAHKEVQSVLVEGAEEYGHGSPWDSLSKIAEIIRNLAGQRILPSYFEKYSEQLARIG
jgi:hypothetical protein